MSFSFFDITHAQHLCHTITSLFLLHSPCCSLAAAEEFELADALSGDLEGLQEEIRSRNNRRKFLQGRSVGWNPGPGSSAAVDAEHTGIEECQVKNREVYVPIQSQCREILSLVKCSNLLHFAMSYTPLHCLDTSFL